MFENLKVVTIGGGTGLSTMLRGLKKFTEEITAIVTVADDGGGSGVLREELGMLPPGDIRSCIVALSNVEPSMEKLMSYRFREGALKGQSFGNLFLAAMNDIYGSFDRAVVEASKVLAVSGRVLPMTLEPVQLCAILENGLVVKGESTIPKESILQSSSIRSVYLEPEGRKPLAGSIDAIMNADVLVLGPGSLFTSIIPNLLVCEIGKAISSSRAKKIYVVNIMTQPGETLGFSVRHHIEKIYDYIKPGSIDEIVVNKGIISEEILVRYREEGAEQVLLQEEDLSFCTKNRIGVIEDNFVEMKNTWIRHNEVKLCQAIINSVYRYFV